MFGIGFSLGLGFGIFWGVIFIFRLLWEGVYGGGVSVRYMCFLGSFFFWRREGIFFRIFRIIETLLVKRYFKVRRRGNF